ncbi:SDR family oxidoreductase [Nocardioides carbamazepini]|uniref:SDR family oxidoreductase n=1 Tax=Nocardioides carbamazepini TaxID=2854259 RepID=UPI002149E042|nr:SDR family oxidoreductase [Nocardioides carbamazepini]MCR1782905.1 SDR family oxidoreductase [Nocardioides carbamazepini]
MDLQLKDRVYLLTGATRGLGRATAEALVADGARVVVSGRKAASVDAAVAALGGPEHARGVVADNADPGTPAALIDAARGAWGRVDGVLISVGGPPPGLITEMSDEQWTAAFGSVFLGAVRLAREVGAVLGDGGSIAFVLSTSVREPILDLAISNGLRPGLAMAAKTLADELGPRGIRVNGVLPGRVGTERIIELDSAQGDPDAARARATARIPLRRYGRPEEFGRVAAFVLSPAASYLSGVMLPVDGGSLRAL